MAAVVVRFTGVDAVRAGDCLQEFGGALWFVDYFAVMGGEDGGALEIIDRTDALAECALYAAFQAVRGRGGGVRVGGVRGRGGVCGGSGGGGGVKFWIERGVLGGAAEIGCVAGEGPVERRWVGSEVGGCGECGERGDGALALGQVGYPGEAGELRAPVNQHPAGTARPVVAGASENKRAVEAGAD